MSTEQPTAVLGHHLASFSAGDVDVTMEDYYRGAHALHAEGLLKRLEASAEYSKPSYPAPSPPSTVDNFEP